MLTKLKLFLVKVISIIFPLFKITRIQYNLIEALTIKKNNYKIDKSSDKLIRSLKIKDKISVLDVGAQDGFFLPGNFSNLNFKKYLSFLNIILVEPNKREAEKLKSKNLTLIKNGFWSKKCKKQPKSVENAYKRAHTTNKKQFRVRVAKVGV